jgi:hypothetical protein
MDEQLLRMVLPTKLLSEIDEHLAAEGSSRTRTDFVREAIEQRLLELRFQDAPVLPDRRERRFSANEDGLDAEEEVDLYAEGEVDLTKEPLASPSTLADTQLPAPAGATFAHRDTIPFPMEPGPFFLHGRDYPSLWSLWWLARWAGEGPLDLSHYLKDVTDLAWRFAEHLREFDRVRELRVTTMFPTSMRNPDSASQTFQAAAIGGVVRRRGGTRVAVGPLVLWGVARIYERGERTRIAPTELGLDLLTRLEGLSLELPHDVERAATFLGYLRENAPTDFTDFQTVLRLVAEAPHRKDLVAAVVDAELGGTKKLGDVYAQAYVSRGREWGLIEPRLVAGAYRLTAYGVSYLNGT